MPRKTKQNEITSPELLNQVNPDNVRLKQDFIAYLQSVQRSPKTIAGYSKQFKLILVIEDVLDIVRQRRNCRL